MKTVKVILTSVKSSDDWASLAFALWFDDFKIENSDVVEDELADKFYNEVISKKFKYGEYANLELEINEDLKIVGGRIFEEVIMRFLGLVITTRKKFEKLTETHQIGRVQYSGHTFDSYVGSIGVLENQIKQAARAIRQLIEEKEQLKKQKARAIRQLIEEKEQLKKQLKEVKKKRKDSLWKSKKD